MLRVFKKVRFVIYKKLLFLKEFLLKYILCPLLFDYSVDDLGSITYEQLPFPTDWFKLMHKRELVVEIGSGHGEFAKFLSGKLAGSAVISFEKKSRFYRMSKLKVKDSNNLLYLKADAYTAIPKLFKAKSIDSVYIMFPDPWNKKRHFKRRPNVAKLFRYLKPNGKLFLVSDHDEFFSYVLENLANYKKEVGEYTPEKFDLCRTHYYNKWLRKGRSFKYVLCYNTPDYAN